MQNNGLDGYYSGFRAIMLHTFGVQVGAESLPQRGLGCRHWKKLRSKCGRWAEGLDYGLGFLDKR